MVEAELLRLVDPGAASDAVAASAVVLDKRDLPCRGDRDEGLLPLSKGIASGNCGAQNSVFCSWWREVLNLDEV
jgi:hypothetical protein